MMDQANQKRLMVRYLYGELSAAERIEFEERYLQEDAVFHELAALENEIVDQYILGELPHVESKRFETFYLADPERRRAVENARHFLAHCTAAENAPFSQPTGTTKKEWFHSRVAQLAAAVFLLALGMTIWLILGNLRMARDLTRLRQEQAAAMQGKLALEQQIENLKADVQQRDRTLHQLAGAMQNMVPFTLESATVRGAGKTTTLVVPRGTAYILLHVMLPANSEVRYDLSIRTADGGLVWKQNRIEGAIDSTHAKELTVIVPSRALKNGDYVLRVSGANEDILHTLAGYSFQVMHEMKN